MSAPTPRPPAPSPSPSRLLRLATPDEVALRREPLDAATLAQAATIVEGVRAGGEGSLRSYAERFGELAPGAPLTLAPAELRRALDAIPTAARVVLESAAERIRAFARAQRACLSDLDAPITAGGVCVGRAGHRVVPVDRAGCYAPGGRFPLPSSVLMTAITAREAGVPEVVVASPRPAPVTLAAAVIAGADRFVVVGGAHAVASLAFGVGTIVPPCDIIVGPGNRWVTAAKHVVSAVCGIDMLAGPSEVLIIADDSADPAVVAADLLAQAEHDPDAVPLLVTTSRALADAVDRQLAAQLATLPTAPIASASLTRGAAVVVPSLDAACDLSNRLGPEHLELIVRDADRWIPRLRHFGALFIGGECAEVLGDYGLGPNHVLPTGGSARHAAGLSVFTFLRARTWLRLDPAAPIGPIYETTAAFARLEGLEGHARAAESRL